MQTASKSKKDECRSGGDEGVEDGADDEDGDDAPGVFDEIVRGLHMAVLDPDMHTFKDPESLFANHIWSVVSSTIQFHHLKRLLPAVINGIRTRKLNQDAAICILLYLNMNMYFETELARLICNPLNESFETFYHKK